MQQPYTCSNVLPCTWAPSSTRIWSAYSGPGNCLGVLNCELLLPGGPFYFKNKSTAWRLPRTHSGPPDPVVWVPSFAPTALGEALKTAQYFKTIQSPVQSIKAPPSFYSHFRQDAARMLLSTGQPRAPQHEVTHHSMMKGHAYLKPRAHAFCGLGQQLRFFGSFLKLPNSQQLETSRLLVSVLLFDVWSKLP